MLSIALALATIVVSLGLLCSCGGRKEMSNQVIVQNEAFTLTRDSIIEGPIYACVKSDRIESNVKLDQLDSIYQQFSNSFCARQSLAQVQESSGNDA